MAVSVSSVVIEIPIRASTKRATQKCILFNKIFSFGLFCFTWEEEAEAGDDNIEST